MKNLCEYWRPNLCCLHHNDACIYLTCDNTHVNTEQIGRGEMSLVYNHSTRTLTVSLGQGVQDLRQARKVIDDEQGVASIFMKNPYRDQDEIQDLIFYGPKPRRNPGLKFFTDQNQDKIKIDHRSSGRLRKQEKARANRWLRGAHPHQ